MPVLCVKLAAYTQLCSISEGMRLTASSKKYVLMKKCALIRKVSLTTRVYGNDIHMAPDVVYMIYDYAFFILYIVYIQVSHSERGLHMHDTSRINLVL